LIGAFGSSAEEFAREFAHDQTSVTVRACAKRCGRDVRARHLRGRTVYRGASLGRLSSLLRAGFPLEQLPVDDVCHRGQSRERSVDHQTKHEITLVTIATLMPIPLITAAVISIILS
jgi:hypothetical protein